jgi:uncharacterized membrane protein
MVLALGERQALTMPRRSWIFLSLGVATGLSWVAHFGRCSSDRRRASRRRQLSLPPTVLAAVVLGESISWKVAWSRW